MSNPNKQDTSSSPLSTQQQQSPLRVAVLGAGIFATNSHAPVLKNNPQQFEVLGVWSRSRGSSEKLADILDATPYDGEEGLRQILQLPQLEAVIMALPLDIQPDFIRKVLQAGKHVLSEKPVAATVEQGLELVKTYRQQYASKLQWSVAENFRYEPALVYMAQAAQKCDPFMISLTLRTPFRPDNIYLNTSWRNQPSWYGGLFVDAFIHTAALLRMIVLGNITADINDNEVDTTVSTRTTSQAEYIPSVDSLVGHIQWKWADNNNNNNKDNNPRLIQAALSVTYACTQQPKVELLVTGRKGDVLLQRRLGQPGYRVSEMNGGNTAEEKEFNFGGIEAEFLAFASAAVSRREQDKKESTSSCRQGDCNTPEQALYDLALVEACLKSGQSDGAIVSVAKPL